MLSFVSLGDVNGIQFMMMFLKLYFVWPCTCWCLYVCVRVHARPCWCLYVAVSDTCVHVGMIV